MSEGKVLRRMTAEEFFAWQVEQDVKYELVGGLPVLAPKAMTGASRLYDTIAVNMIGSLGTQLRGRSCRLHTDNISIRNANGNIRRPDILIDCQSQPDHSMEVTEPRVVIEILSPPTASFDRFQKIEEYKAHPGVRVVLLVDSEAPRVIVWRRQSEVGWTSQNVEGIEATIALTEIDAVLTMTDIYDDTGIG